MAAAERAADRLDVIVVGRDAVRRAHILRACRQGVPDVALAIDELPDVTMLVFRLAGSGARLAIVDMVSVADSTPAVPTMLKSLSPRVALLAVVEDPSVSGLHGFRNTVQLTGVEQWTAKFFGKLAGDDGRDARL